jgi:glucan 1,3-beta-glucosidase
VSPGVSVVATDGGVAEYVEPSSSSTNTAVTSSSTSTLPSPIRGVNIGGWLVLEKWMNPEIFSDTTAVDQWSFDSTPNAASKLHHHWSTYFTQHDVQKIASYGINTLRIPIGYWAYNNTGTPYVQGADDYLEKAIGWAREAGLKVLVDCHGSPGSQNGFDNSGHEGDVAWQADDNLQLSIDVLTTIAQKYGAQEYADVVFAIEMVNEPISWDQNNFDTTKTWAQQAYTAVRAAATNEDLMVFMHDGFMGPSNWEDVSSAINGDSSIDDAKFALDVHLYQNQEASDSELTQAQHIAKACNWTASEFLPSSSNLPVFVGEFSTQTNICANPDGSTVAGSTCDIDGCQCSSNVPLEYWSQPLVDATRMFVEAEMDTFEQSSRGWFLWAYKAPGVWGLANAIEYGVIGKTVTDRKFPAQCASASNYI